MTKKKVKIEIPASFASLDEFKAWILAQPKMPPADVITEARTRVK